MRFKATPALAVSALLVVAGPCLAEAHDEVGAQGEIAPTQHAKPIPAEANEVDALFNIMLGIATVIFLIIEGGILWSIIFFRRRKGDDHSSRV